VLPSDDHTWPGDEARVEGVEFVKVGPRCLKGVSHEAGIGELVGYIARDGTLDGEVLERLRGTNRIAKKVRMWDKNCCGGYGGGASCVEVFFACDGIASSSLHSSSNLTSSFVFWTTLQPTSWLKMGCLL